MTRALHAEWTKLRTVTAPWWLLLGAIAGVVAGRVVAAGLPGVDAFIGIELGQALTAVFGVLMFSGEHTTGTIRTSLIAVPRRISLLTAKAIVLIAVTGPLTVGIGALTAGIGVSAGVAGILQASHLVLVALIGLGTATVVRDSAAGIGVVLGLLYLPALLAQATGEAWVQRFAPSTTEPGITAGWALAALAAGCLAIIHPTNTIIRPTSPAGHSANVIIRLANAIIRFANAVIRPTDARD
ncbi:ABC transporter permease subunit [Actinoplanes couchii]|uniref:Uncharacterized protein n=1 Tax=Actinoplanes couchii TaxID=403638 RepID=A0ABQ3XQK1_9ACTN|nr:ABC transporter permease subunit [Actinoplanes couchii]MDR6317491.1 ABC-2 type transport system permease protein [Actinoplanes couchii]GID60794.1 hypothetical protein Aco03nite_091980 [Actinoplanes couchii]